jgi:hypothetical protein
VLRQHGPETTDAVEPPQPTLAGLEALVDQARRHGDDVRLDLGDGTAGWLTTVPEGASRAAYRLVQEGLTNARKHAPGAPVTVRLQGSPGTHPRRRPAQRADRPGRSGEGAARVGPRPGRPA